MKVKANDVEGGREVMYGTCRFCGQTMNVTVFCDEDASEAEMNNAATAHCDCPGAQQFMSQEAAKERALGVINAMIPDEELKGALQQLVSPVCEGNLKKVSVDDGMGTKYSMHLKNGLIEVQISVTNVTVRS